MKAGVRPRGVIFSEKLSVIARRLFSDFALVEECHPSQTDDANHHRPNRHSSASGLHVGDGIRGGREGKEKRWTHILQLTGGQVTNPDKVGAPVGDPRDEGATRELLVFIPCGQGRGGGEM